MGISKNAPFPLQWRGIKGEAKQIIRVFRDAHISQMELQGGAPQGLGGDNMQSMIFTSHIKMYNYAIMSIERNKITYDVYNQAGEKIDYFEIIK